MASYSMWVRLLGTTSKKLLVLSLSILFFGSCASSTTDSPDLLSVETESAEASTAVSEIEPVEADFELAVARWESCLSSGGLVRSSVDLSFIVTPELTGLTENQPLNSETARLAESVFTECQSLLDGVIQEGEAPQPDDPGVLEFQRAFSSCMGEAGYEIELTIDGFSAHPPGPPDSPEYQIWEDHLLFCETQR